MSVIICCTIINLLFTFGRAMIFIDDENWYADDGQLSRIICELVEETSNAVLPSECCACDHAKYKVIQVEFWICLRKGFYMIYYIYIKVCSDEKHSMIKV